MPQKPFFSRPPVIAVPHSFPAAGTVRASDDRINSLYQKASIYLEQPILWEGLFKIACLLTNKPADEPVAVRIINAYKESEDGAFRGSLSEQISIARASLALFEYNTDRSILVRLSSWLQYIEKEYDNLIMQDGVLFQPADLMEFLVRFYFATGSKCALRLCSKLRAGSFDWTTVLHTFQQSIPIKQADERGKFHFPPKKPDEIEYNEKEELINHSELLADGVRYTLFSGLYSGHSMDISAGQTVWSYLIKHHHALCGGVTGNPYLSGCSADQTVNNYSLFAWTEAFAAQMILSDFSWAASELIRIIFNGLDECLNHDEMSDTQRINTICETNNLITDPVHFYARLTRTVSLVYNHAVTLKQNGIIINYLLPGRYILMVSGQKVLLQTDYEKAIIKTKKPFSDTIEIYDSSTGPGLYKRIRKDEKEEVFHKAPNDKNTCLYISADSEWHDHDIIQFCPEEHNIIYEKTHHQGVALLYCNRLMCMPVKEMDFARAVCAMPIKIDKQITVMTGSIKEWKCKEGQPGDIPVLPEKTENPVSTELVPYSFCKRRITMFPRVR